MFTGLVEVVGRVQVASRTAAGLALVVDSGSWGHRPAEGESISVHGCCLTVAAGSKDRAMVFDVVSETLAKTTLGRFQVGTPVNLEHAATASTLLGGHVVQGHVDGVGVVDSVLTGEAWRVRIRPDPGVMEYIAPKGSVAVDGVSLTVAQVDPAAGWFEVALIPTTLAKTTLGRLKAGDLCNIEADSIAKTIVHWLKHYGQGRAASAG